MSSELAAPTPFRSVLSTLIRLLTFRATTAELAQLNTRHLLIGLICTWVVGVGRYWDNPRAAPLQRIGVGSIIYVVVFSFLLWLIVLPMRPKRRRYMQMLTFVSLVSPPAILYAIPVERFFSIDDANTINVIFLAIVATWRVALLLFFLRRYAEMDPFTIVISSLLPLTLIVTTLTILNLERVVFNLMGGLTRRSAADSSYFVLILLTQISLVLFIPVVLSYIILAVVHFRNSRATQ